MKSTITTLMDVNCITDDKVASALPYSSLLTDVTEIYEVEEYIGTRYKGDLYGVFNFLDIPRAKWLETLRLNGFKSPLDYNGEQLTIYEYDRTAVNTAIHLREQLSEL